MPESIHHPTNPHPSNSVAPGSPQRKRKRLNLALLPTALTLGNGACGMGAIAIAVSDAPKWSADSDGQLFGAGLLVFAGMLFDMLDGRAARLTGQSSEFGAQLDSLCDAITFGVAPAVILWQVAEVYPERFRWVFGVLFTLCVIVRLARFNVETKEDSSHDEFDGLPSPAAAGAIASFATALPQLSQFRQPDAPPTLQLFASKALLVAQWGLPVLAVVLSYLMVSRFRYPHFFQQWFGGNRTPYQVGQLIFAAVFVFIAREIAVPLIFCYFAFESPIRQLAMGRVQSLRSRVQRHRNSKMGTAHHGE